MQRLKIEIFETLEYATVKRFEKRVVDLQRLQTIMNQASRAAESLARVRRRGSCREGTVGRVFPVSLIGVKYRSA